MTKGQLAEFMRQAQQMQENMQKSQEELANTCVEGRAGAHLVKITLSCDYSVKKVNIDGSLMKDDEKEMLEDLMAAACNDALRQVEAKRHQKMASIAAGIPLSAGMKLPFFGG